MSVDADFIAEVWDVLRVHVDINDRGDAATDLVDLLIDNDYEVEDLKDAFRGNKEIITALKFYADTHDLETDDDEDEEDNDDD